MIKIVLWPALLLVLCSCSASLSQLAQTDVFSTGNSQLVRGIKEALELGSARASDQLGQPGGYANNPAYRITLPDNLQAIAGTLRQFGLGGQIDTLEALMNQGAEKAAVQAKSLFIDAARNMTVTDALTIVRGDQTAATEYFRGQTETNLRGRFEPIIQQNLRQLGFYDQYKGLLSLYQKLPIANKPNLNLEDYAVNQGLNALFRQVAEEEKQIRADPIGRGSQLIGSVFR